MQLRSNLVLLVCIALISCTGSEEPSAQPTPGGGCNPTVVVYLDAGVSEARQRAVGRLLDERPEVQSTRYHSPAEAYREFRRVYRGQKEILKGRTVDDFPGFYEVTLIGEDAFESFEASLVGGVGIDKLVPGGCGGTEGATP